LGFFVIDHYPLFARQAARNALDHPGEGNTISEYDNDVHLMDTSREKRIAWVQRLQCELGGFLDRGSVDADVGRAGRTGRI
jgi:hypothetical protein